MSFIKVVFCKKLIDPDVEAVKLLNVINTKQLFEKERLLLSLSAFSSSSSSTCKSSFAEESEILSG